MPYRRFAYLGLDVWLEYAPTNGAYALHRCAHERWRLGLPPLCANLCPSDEGCGHLADLAGETRVLYLGHDAVLALHLPTGAYAMLRLQRGGGASLVAPPAVPPTAEGSPLAGKEGTPTTGLRGTLPALAGREVAFVGSSLLVALDPHAKDAKFFLLARNASEVWSRGSPLRAVLSTPPSTSTVLAAGAQAHGGRLVGLSGGRLLTVTPKSAGDGFAYELIKCAAAPCAAPDCALLADAAPTGGEVTCAPIGAGSVGTDGAALAAAARTRDAAVESGRRGTADVDADGVLSMHPLDLPSVVPPQRGSGRRQWVLLDGSHGASGLAARALLEYDAPSGDVRILRLGLPAPLPTTPTAAAAAASAAAVSSTAASAANIASCDAIPLPPASRSSWAFPSHRLSSLGGTSLLDVDVSTSQFRVWDCLEAVPPAPTPASAAAAAAASSTDPPPNPAPDAATVDGTSGADAATACVAVDHGVWPPLSSHSQAVWLGPTLSDTLLLFDGVTGRYEVWPLRTTRERTMPRPGQRALAAGTWASLIGHTLVHAGGSTLIVLDASTGSFEIVLVDSTSFVEPPTPRGSTDAPPTITYGRLAAGTLGSPTVASAADVGRRLAGASPSAAAAMPLPSRPCALSYHAPTYLGDDLLLSVEPSSGAYCILRLAREKPQLPPLEHVGGGQLRRKPCDHQSCGACSAEEGCGWCASSGQCLQGNAVGPCGGGCREHWTYGYCAEQPCALHATCDDCLQTELCGWCASRQLCMAGSDAEPLHLSCPADYRYQTCAGRIANATVVPP